MDGPDDRMPPRLGFAEKGSFAWRTIVQRMPVILTDVIDEVHRELGSQIESGASDADVAAAKAAIRMLSRLKYEMQTDKPLRPIENLPVDSPLLLHDDTEFWNTELIEPSATSVWGVSSEKLSWFSAPWLLAECYMYRRITAAMQSSKIFATFDPFRSSKEKSYTSSTDSVKALALAYNDIVSMQSVESQFTTLLQFSLWGNKMDLSLHAGAMSTAEGGAALRAMQSSSEQQLSALASNILSNDSAAVWSALNKDAEQTSGGAVHIVLDNAGYELFTDMMLGHFLVTQIPSLDNVVFHTKTLPWFVSDASVADFEWLVGQLEASAEPTLGALGTKFRDYLESGQWVLRPHRFWTLPHELGRLPTTAPELASELNTARLVVLKGDLNYRKLLADRDWPHSTPFSVACVPRLCTTPFVALRTCKATLVCGVAEADESRAASTEPEWLVTGKFGVIQFA